MLVRKAYRFRIYPDAAQGLLFRRTIGCCRFVYNLCLDQKVLERQRSNPRPLSSFDQIKELKNLKREVEWLQEVPHHAIVQAVVDLHKAFRNFFEGRANFPAFRRKGENESFRYPDPKQVRVEDGRIFLPKAGWTRMVMHRPVAGAVRNVTVSASAGDWHVSIQVEQSVADPALNQGGPVGVDLGVARPIVLSDGRIIDLPRVTEGDRRRLAAAQRAVARRQKGSRNKAKALKRVARLQARFARRRRDAAHKATTMIAKNHGVIVVEDLMVANLTASARGTVESPGRNVRQKAGLNRSLLDMSPRQIRTMLEYKAPWFGATVIAVNPAYTSQECHACGTVDAASRVSQSQFICRCCGSIADADVNAARNILRRGLGPTGGLPGMACGSSRTAGRKQEDRSRKGRSSALQGRE